MNSSSVIELSNILFRRGNNIILKDISWTVNESENWVIFGPNGCGKTTLLNIITGYLWPVSGKVKVLNETFGSVDLREFRKRIGWVSSALNIMVPADTNVFEMVLSGFQATLGVKETHSREDVEKAEEILDFLGASYAAEKVYGVLSQGEKQKVMLARALIHEPEILILDEACAGLDLKARENILTGISNIIKSGKTRSVLFVTHHVEEIYSEFTKSIILNNGKVLAAGETSAVMTGYNLSKAFGIDVGIENCSGRFSVKFK
ncbi:MAG: ABC transporter ATP-binding protein [Planctomycetota bacterium]|jgi:iron complex transport system ATP-binding protein